MGQALGPGVRLRGMQADLEEHKTDAEVMREVLALLQRFERLVDRLADHPFLRTWLRGWKHDGR